MILIEADDEKGGRRRGLGDVGELGDLIVIEDAWRRLRGQKEVARTQQPWQLWGSWESPSAF